MSIQQVGKDKLHVKTVKSRAVKKDVDLLRKAVAAS